MSAHKAVTSEDGAAGAASIRLIGSFRSSWKPMAGLLWPEAQKLLIDAFRFAAGKEKHFWMRRLSVALQKGNAMTFDAYCEWRNTRDLRVHGQAGFIAKRKQQRRPRQADAFLFRPSVPRFDHLIWSVCAREASEDR
jgi:hypothetical protein